jgi:hypothetical protein
VDVCVVKEGTKLVAGSYVSWTDLRVLNERRLPTLLFIAPDGSMRQIQVSVDPLYRGTVNARQVFGGGMCVEGGLREVYPGVVEEEREELDAPPSYEE